MAHIQTQYGGLWKPQDLALDKISSQKMFIDNIDFIESFIKEGKQKVHPPVKTITDLRAIDTSDTTLFTTGMLIMVYEIGIFYFNRNATGTDSSDIVTPTTGGGRWILIASSGGSDPITPESIGAAPSTHASQHATNGRDPITPASIGAMPSMKRTFIYDGINSTKELTTAGWYRILKHDSLNDKAFLINIGHQYSDTGPENVLFFVCSMPSCPSIVVLSHSNNPSRPTIIFYKKIRITKDSNYMYIDFYRAQDGDVCIPRVSIIEFVIDATTVQDKKGEPLDVLPVDEAPDGETVLLMQDVSVIPSGNVLTDANKAKSVAITLTASGWNSSSKTQTVTVSGVLADETKQLITPTPALASQAAYYEAVVLCTRQSANQLTFTAKKIPTADLTVYVTIQEVSA